MTEFSNTKKTRFVLKIAIIGNTASLFLISGRKKIIAESKWEDNKDLSKRLLEKADFLLKKKKFSLSNISKVDFFCDFPYYKSKRKNIKIASIANKKPKKTCGFTAWQTGEITAKVLNFINYPSIIINKTEKAKPKKLPTATSQKLWPITSFIMG